MIKLHLLIVVFVTYRQLIRGTHGQFPHGNILIYMYEQEKHGNLYTVWLALNMILLNITLL